MLDALLMMHLNGFDRSLGLDFGRIKSLGIAIKDSRLYRYSVIQVMYD